MEDNVFGLCEGRASRHKSFNLAQCLIVVQMFNKPLMPCFCKTGCYMPFFFAVNFLTFK